MKTLVGRLPASSAVVQVDYDAAILAVDELIRPPELNEYLTPGFVDLQVNGFGGVDYNDPASSADAIANSIRRMAATGVSRFYPTVITGSRDGMADALSNLAKAKAEMERSGLPEGRAMEAFHMEGPHICPGDGARGAHPREHVRPPDTSEFDRMQEAARGNIRLITISPEWEAASRYIAHVVRTGVVASIGHTRATADQISAAVDAGATMSTHLGNGADAVLPKTRNYIWDQLANDSLTASFILDDIHIPRPFIRTALRAKGLERCVLVTDAVMPAQCEPGPYTLGEVPVELLPNGSVVMRGSSRLAGSALTMNTAVMNAVKLGRISLPEAIVTATTNPARVGRVGGRQRGLTPGEKADFVRFLWDENTQHLTVLETVTSGVTLFRRSSA